MDRRNNYDLVGSIICNDIGYLVFFELSLLFITISRRNIEIKTSVAIEHSWINIWSNKNYLGTRLVWQRHLLIQLFKCTSVDSVFSPSLQTLRQSCTRFHVNNIINISWVGKSSQKQPRLIISTTIILMK